MWSYSGTCLGRHFHHWPPRPAAMWCEPSVGSAVAQIPWPCVDGLQWCIYKVFPRRTHCWVEGRHWLWPSFNNSSSSSSYDPYWQCQCLFPHSPHTLELLSTKTISPPYPEIESLLCKFESLFQTPTTLPPSRSTNHSIQLPNSKLVNVWPYRYPYFQKHEIETQVEAMMQRGIIRPNTSPFSSSVLLVKKSDWSWRFCIDCRALNAIIVKDHFLILTIDKL